MKTRGLVLDPEVSRDVQPDAVTLYDRSRFGNNGAMTNVTWVRLASGLWVMSFDGVDDRINCGAGASLAITSDISIELWINPNSLGENNAGRPVEKTQYLIAQTGTQTILFLIIDAGGAKIAQAPNGSAPFGKWTYVVGVFNSINVLIYTDAVVTVGDATAGPILPNAAQTLYLGDSAASNRCVDGLVGLVKIHNHALSPGKILQLYETERQLFGV